MYYHHVLFVFLFLFVALLAHPVSAQPQTAAGKYVPPTNPEEVQPLAVGVSIPRTVLPTPQGTAFDVNAAVAQQPTILIFYRGGWCPYCNMQLGQLQEIDAELREMGYQIIAISADRPEKLQESIEKHELDYRLLSDSKMTASTAFGIAFRLDDATIARYERYGLDLQEYSGEDHHMLPVPAVFILDRGGVVRYQYANPDYKVRIDPDVLIAEARAALER